MSTKGDNATGVQRKMRVSKGKKQNSQSYKQSKRIIARQKYPPGKDSNLFSHLELGVASVESLVYFTEGTPDYLPPLTSDGSTTMDSPQPTGLRIHPAFIQLGMDYATGRIHGSSARCAAFVAAFLTFLADYKAEDSTDLLTQLTTDLDALHQYLDDCRTLPIPLHNILQRCRDIIARRSRVEDMSNTTIIQEISRETLDLQFEIEAARRSTVQSALQHIHDKDVILTYAASQVVLDTLLSTKKEGKTIKVIVVDSRPLLEGKSMIEKLVHGGIDCEYALISSLSYTMRGVNKVLLGAHAMLSNGSVLSRSGTALVCMTAQGLNVPVLVCCESFKFSKRVQIDAISYNELNVPESIIDNNDPFSPKSTFTQIGYHQVFPQTQEEPPVEAKPAAAAAAKKGGAKTANPTSTTLGAPTEPRSLFSNHNHTLIANNVALKSTFMSTTTLTNERSVDNWVDTPTLKLLTLRYDLTPSNLISAVMTEFDTIPPTSASVIVREIEKKHSLSK